MKTIVVAGDVAIDWLAWEKDITEYSSPDNRPQFNWIKNTGLHMCALPGGATLLSHMVELSLKGNDDAQVVSYHLTNPENIPPSKIIHSITLCAEYPVQAGKPGRVFRVKHHCGYSGPDDGVPPPLSLDQDDPDATIILLDDAGNGFRNQRDVWPAAIITPGKKPQVILKMSYPLVEGPLWEYLLQNHKDRLIVIVNARDIRASGADISYRLSWEHTAETFFSQIQKNIRIRSLTMCKALIVRFGVEGAILYRKEGSKESAQLFYDPATSEDGFFSQYPGSMHGMFCAFASGFSKSLLDSDGIDECVLSGMHASRNLIRHGLGPFPGKPGYEFTGIFSPRDEGRREIADIDIPQPRVGSDEGSRWTILESVTQSHLEEIAENIVLSGTHPSLNPVPVGAFGGLRTVDRKEIESYQSIRNILQEYIQSDNAKPISIAVFGPPGSGKSFGVTQLARSIAHDRIISLEFNLSQFKEIKDLTTAFNAIQDKVLEGKLPLVFFDEFDGDFNGPLGWLKLFLAPMQDGKFKDGEVMHPIGKSIFVFAGGTCDTFDEFRDGTEDQKVHERLFRNAKGTDFISRLRGYVNIMGCTREEDLDSTCIIRRALLLRSIIEQNFRNLLDSDDTARIDKALVKSFLRVRSYRHGIRSMQAIFYMSMISTKDRFDISDLPSTEQLRLHVKMPEFTDLILQYSLLESAIEAIAQQLHEQYLLTMKSSGKTSPSSVPWNELSKEYKESNRKAAQHITEKLKAINCWFILKEPADIKLYSFDPGDHLALAKMEHERWCREKKGNGWKYGESRDEIRKIHPDMLPWEKLTEEARKKDCEAVAKIPQIMADMGFEVYKLSEV